MMKKITIFSVFLLSVMVGSAIALDIPALYTSVQVNPGGKGDALIASIFDVRDLTVPGVTGATPAAQQTLINIVNTDTVHGVMVRVRFRSYFRSQELLDFHLPLSPGDVFSALVYKSNPNGLGAGKVYIFSDHFIAKALGTDQASDYLCSGGATTWTFTNRLSIADPVAPADPVLDPNGGKGVPFSTANISASDSIRLQRTYYGYFEIIAEESLPAFDSETASSVGRRGCGLQDAPNSLFGEAWVVRVSNAVAAEYALTAISNFSVNPDGIANRLGTLLPNLRDSVQGAPGQPGFGGLKQLEFVLSKSTIDFQYLNDPALAATTSAIVTFPTKWAHFVDGVTAPFTGPFETIEDGATDQFGITVWDRHENKLTPIPGEIIFSPVPPGVTVVPRWPYEVNILGVYDHAVTLPTPPGIGFFRDNAIINSFLTSSGQHFTSGWIELDLTPGLQGDAGSFNFFFNSPTATPPSSGSNFTEYNGLPAIGIVLTEVLNSAIGPVGGYFNGTIPWAYGVDWL